MKKTIRSILTVAGILCLAAAIGLGSYNIYDSYRANKQSSDVMEKLAYAVSEKEKSTQNSDETPDYITHPDMEMPTVEIDGRRYIGHLEIPDLNLRLPVAAGEFKLKTLLKSPALYSGSVYKNNMVIAAHNYNSHFGRLKKLDIGAKVIFVDAEGNIFNFVTASSEILYPSNCNEL
jgi:sortase A